MKSNYILFKYILKNFLFYFLVSLLALSSIFLIFDFLDRIDNILAEKPKIGLVLEYFLYKIPLMIHLMFPLAGLAGTLLSVGILSKNSEIIAIRSSGVTLLQIAKPYIYCGLLLTLFSGILGEFIVPNATRKTKDIYNIDIKKKDQAGGYSNSNIWWREKSDFFTVSNFDSRDNTLYSVSKMTVDDKFNITQKTDAEKANFIKPEFGWSLHNLTTYSIFDDHVNSIENKQIFPLPTDKSPKDFYDLDADTTTMNFVSLKRFIKHQKSDGLRVNEYMADLYDKFAFPFICLIVILLVFPLSLVNARTNDMTFSIISAIFTGFSYYAVHSVAISLGRAEILNPIVAAWFTNIFMGIIAFVLLLGAESPR